MSKSMVTPCYLLPFPFHEWLASRFCSFYFAADALWTALDFSLVIGHTGHSAARRNQNLAEGTSRAEAQRRRERPRRNVRPGYLCASAPLREKIFAGMRDSDGLQCRVTGLWGPEQLSIGKEYAYGLGLRPRFRAVGRRGRNGWKACLEFGAALGRSTAGSWPGR
jgi:hypothetical protein